MFPLGLNWKKCIVFSASNAGNEVEPGEIWEPPAIPSLISMNVPPPPKSRNRANNLQQQANHRWEQHKLTGWKGPEPPVRVQPQVHGALPPTGRGRGAWKKGGTLHSVSVPTSKSVPAHNVRPIEVFICSITYCLSWKASDKFSCRVKARSRYTKNKASCLPKPDIILP